MKMCKVRNRAPHVVTIGGEAVIPPLGSATMDVERRGIERLIQQGTLELVQETDKPNKDEGEAKLPESSDRPSTTTSKAKAK